MRLYWRLAIAAALGIGTQCYPNAGAGVKPPLRSFYFPVGLTVSPNGNVLYAINSNFDLQYNGGTLQSYDLNLIRRHAVLTIDDPTNPNLPWVYPPSGGTCPGSTPGLNPDSGIPLPAGTTCAPPVDSSFYVRDSVIVGAFATDLQARRNSADGSVRLFAPVRGDASVTWADVPIDVGVPPESDPNLTYPAFRIDCGTRDNDRCATDHDAGRDPKEPGNTREITLPGEPFAMAFADDTSALVLTHQSSQQTSLLMTGFAPPLQGRPALAFTLDGVPFSGVGIASIPHDRDAYIGCDSSSVNCPDFPRPSFFETSRSNVQVTLLRYYNDFTGAQQVPSSNYRPYLTAEAGFSVSSGADVQDSRGIAIDPTPRIRCKANVPPEDPVNGRTKDDVARDRRACARLPARAFIASRTPASLIIGQVGEDAPDPDATGYNADIIKTFKTIPIPTGPSRVYLAPIVAKDGRYSLRVFVVCFDSATIVVYDPEADMVETTIRVGVGPFAMAFDPFSVEDVALRAVVPADPRQPGLDLRKYRFAYVSSFTHSYVQVLDLDNARTEPRSFETVVFNLGVPVQPKEAQ